ncbi:MAG: 3-oxoadipate enol-lactonase [Gammaproteobacteria bacterium]|nr:3-oxoadipate enol-lactonase [Gammaproteobacteria bacterium]
MRITANDLHVNCQVSGPEGAPVVVLSHSLGSSGVMWEHQVPALVEKYRVVRYDTRGHGGTDAPAGPYSLDMLGDDAVAMLDALDIDRVHWVGLSMGGMIGQNVALRHSARLASAVLCDTTSRVPGEAKSMWDERIAAAEKSGMSALVDATMERWFTAPYRERGPKDLQVIREQFLETPTSGFVGCCQAIRDLDYTDRLAQIDLPVHVIVGDQDPSTPPAAAQAIQERISGASLDIIESAAHMSNVEQPEAFNRSLFTFLDRL